MSEHKITEATDAKAIAVNPGHRMSELIVAVGNLQAQTGLVLRFGAQNVPPGAEEAVPTIAGFIMALGIAKQAIEAVERDVIAANKPKG